MTGFLGSYIYLVCKGFATRCVRLMDCVLLMMPLQAWRMLILYIAHRTRFLLVHHRTRALQEQQQQGVCGRRQSSSREPQRCGRVAIGDPGEEVVPVAVQRSSPIVAMLHRTISQVAGGGGDNNDGGIRSTAKSFGD